MHTNFQFHITNITNTNQWNKNAWPERHETWKIFSIIFTNLQITVLPFVKLEHLDGLVQDCSNSIANALELLQSCTKPSTLWKENISVYQPICCLFRLAKEQDMEALHSLPSMLSIHLTGDFSTHEVSYSESTLLLFNTAFQAVLYRSCSASRFDPIAHLTDLINTLRPE